MANPLFAASSSASAAAPAPVSSPPEAPPFTPSTPLRTKRIRSKKFPGFTRRVPIFVSKEVPEALSNSSPRAPPKVPQKPSPVDPASLAGVLSLRGLEKSLSALHRKLDQLGSIAHDGANYSRYAARAVSREVAHNTNHGRFKYGKQKPVDRPHAHSTDPLPPAPEVATPLSLPEEPLFLDSISDVISVWQDRVRQDLADTESRLNDRLSVIEERIPQESAEEDAPTLSTALSAQAGLRRGTLIPDTSRSLQENERRAAITGNPMLSLARDPLPVPAVSNFEVLNSSGYGVVASVLGSSALSVLSSWLEVPIDLQLVDSRPSALSLQIVSGLSQMLLQAIHIPHSVSAPLSKLFAGFIGQNSLSIGLSIRSWHGLLNKVVERILLPTIANLIAKIRPDCKVIPCKEFTHGKRDSCPKCLDMNPIAPPPCGWTCSKRSYPYCALHGFGSHGDGCDFRFCLTHKVSFCRERPDHADCGTASASTRYPSAAAAADYLESLPVVDTFLVAQLRAQSTWRNLFDRLLDALTPCLDATLPHVSLPLLLAAADHQVALPVAVEQRSLIESARGVWDAGFWHDLNT